MKNRLSTLGKNASWMLILLAVCGMTSSCKDEYILDDQKPAYLQSSILSRLENEGIYTNYLRLLADTAVNPKNARPLTEVLSRTGSKTVFVADDYAWQEFFAKNDTLPESNPWHNATSYENLSTSQKKLLIHTSMLNNAIVMENLASNMVDGSMSRGEYMRRYTDLELTDSITRLDGESLPTNYNTNNEEKDYWWRFRKENGGNGLYLVSDATDNMMVYFTNEHLKKNNVTDEDFKYFMNEDRNTDDVHIYDAKLLEKDAVCENGYVNRTSRLLVPLPNMAEVLRTSGITNIFSHMLDRWSAPFYNRDLTEAYKDLMESRGLPWSETDSIFSKRYFSDISVGKAPLNKDPMGNPITSKTSKELTLKFDPGWNTYYNERANAQYDMAAMYVPVDTTLWSYFTPGGGGWQLIETYHLRVGDKDPKTGESLQKEYVEPVTQEDLFKQIDDIPMGTLKSLLNVIMFNSFTASVPSKMGNLRDDAQEQIFPEPNEYENIVGGMLANNGVIYLTKKVYGPADYTSVAAPAYISNTNKVINWAIYNGSTKGDADYMKLNYYAYLKAMQSRFALFLPSDEALRYYYDALSINSINPRVIAFSYKSKKDAPSIDFKLYKYDFKTGTIKQAAKASEDGVSSANIVNYMKDILESHTIVLNGKEEIDSDIDNYYLAKNGAALKVTRDVVEGERRIVSVQGGFQLENVADGIEGSVSSENEGVYTEAKGVQKNVVVGLPHKKNNGRTYVLDSPIIPAARSVYSVLTNRGTMEDSPYINFYEACSFNEKIVRACGLVHEIDPETGKSTTTSQQNSELKKFQIFYANNNTIDYTVQFFNNYNYTVMVPSNEAMQEAISKGLPTWEEIEDDYDNCEKDPQSGNLVNLEDSIRLQAKITYLTNFVRYHFADNSVFVDNSPIDQEFVTSSYDNVKGLFCKMNINRENGSMKVKDCSGGNWVNISENNNVMARDMILNKQPTVDKSCNSIIIQGASFAVIHEIPAVLNHTPLVNGRYDHAWSSTSNARDYLKHFAIR